MSTVIPFPSRTIIPPEVATIQFGDADDRERTITGRAGRAGFLRDALERLHEVLDAAWFAQGPEEQKAVLGLAVLTIRAALAADDTAQDGVKTIEIS